MDRNGEDFLGVLSRWTRSCWPNPACHRRHDWSREQRGSPRRARESRTSAGMSCPLLGRRAATAAPATVRSRGRGASGSRCSATTSRRTTTRWPAARHRGSNKADPQASLILQKPTLAVDHGGGEADRGRQLAVQAAAPLDRGGRQGCDRETPRAFAPGSHPDRDRLTRPDQTVPLKVDRPLDRRHQRGRHLP